MKHETVNTILGLIGSITGIAALFFTYQQYQGGKESFHIDSIFYISAEPPYRISRDTSTWIVSITNTSSSASTVTNAMLRVGKEISSFSYLQDSPFPKKMEPSEVYQFGLRVIPAHLNDSDTYRIVVYSQEDLD